MCAENTQQRAAEAYKKGALFFLQSGGTSCNSILRKGLPSDLAIADTVHTSARYASICWSERLVPIVEPEIVPNGTHDIAYCAKMTETGVGLSVRSACLAPRLFGRRRPHAKHGQEWPGGPRVDADMVATYTVQALFCARYHQPCHALLSGETVLDEDNEETATISLMR